MNNVIKIINNDITSLIKSSPTLKSTNNNSGIYLAYIEIQNNNDNNDTFLIPYWIQKGKNLGSTWSSQKSRLNNYIKNTASLKNSINPDDYYDNLLFSRIVSVIKDDSVDLSFDCLKAVVLTECDLTDLDDMEIYWSRRLSSDLTSLGHSLFVKNLRRMEYKVLYSKDDRSTKTDLTSRLRHVYKCGCLFIENLMLNKKSLVLNKNCKYALENIKCFNYYMTEKGLPFFEDADVVNLNKVKKEKSIFTSLIKEYVKKKD